MSTKGIKINKFLVKKIISCSSTIPNKFFRGLETLNGFKWSSFNRKEFDDLIDLFNYLILNDCFLNIGENSNFIFNYCCDITEMDIVAALTKNDEDILIDIETKNGDDFAELSSKMRTQLEKRKADHIPQLIKNKSFLTVGFVNKTFIDGYYFDGDSLMEIDTFEKFKNVSNTFSDNNKCDDFLIQSANIASIVKACTDISSGKFKYYESIHKTYKTMTSEMADNDACIVYGNAGTGKSILALKCFFELTNTKILLLNSKLYYALNFYGLYKSNLATYNSKKFLEFITPNTISIIDECQRLNLDFIKSVIRKSKFTFLFGDNKQAFVKGSTLLSAKELAEKLKFEEGLNVTFHCIKKARRYSEEVDAALSFLTEVSPGKIDLKIPKDYEINIYYDESVFVNKYLSIDGIKKIYAPISDYNSSKINIGGYTFERATFQDDNFSLWKGGIEYYGTTYHALSFDIDHCFVVLNKTKMIRFDKKIVMFNPLITSTPTFEDIQLYLNDLNICFTRGRKSLNILAKDIETYLYLSFLVQFIKSN